MDRARYCVPKSPAQHPRQADSLPYARWIDGIHELTRMDTNVTAFVKIRFHPWTSSPLRLFACDQQPTPGRYSACICATAV